MWESRIAPYAQTLLQRFRGSLSLENIKQVLVETDNTKRCPANIIFTDNLPQPNKMAWSEPNQPRDWVEYTVLVKNCLRPDEDGQRLVLAHELGHVVFGQYPLIDELECNKFAAILLGITYEYYKAQCILLYNKYGVPFNNTRFA